MWRSLMFYTSLLLSLTAYAETETYNRVDFQVEAAREINNDLLTATMSVEFQDRQPARVAQQLNAVLNAALQKSAEFSNVKTTSGSQNTVPVYGKNNQIDAWRGHGEIHLQSRDFKAAGELIMQLQSTLQLSDVQFGIAPETRASLETELISAAIKAFQNRADAIRVAMNAKSYKVVNFSIGTGGVPQHYPLAMMRGAVASAAIPAPEFSAGDTRMSVQINGTIEVQ